jgi:copper chaperone CopZ
MAPLSVLPGRIRFESPDIEGNFKASEYLEREIQKLGGVLEASVNYRTGRILVKFNENLTDRRIITEGIKKIIKNMPEEQLKSGFYDIQKTAELGLFKHALIDAVAHALLPKPFNILLPLAINTIKR